MSYLKAKKTNGVGTLKKFGFPCLPVVFVQTYLTSNQFFNFGSV
jgi:hypothetical protein